MNGEAIGRLERVELRNVWVSERGDFTPWLGQADNLKLLGETIGLELELQSQEKEVGPVRADLLCGDLATEQRVLIENQLERTDHVQLAQVITYAAGLEAVTVVWVAARFTEEHRGALDWLHEVSGEGARFFGLGIEHWRIGPSVQARAGHFPHMRTDSPNRRTALPARGLSSDQSTIESAVKRVSDSMSVILRLFPDVPTPTEMQ